MKHREERFLKQILNDSLNGSLILYVLRHAYAIGRDLDNKSENFFIPPLEALRRRRCNVNIYERLIFLLLISLPFFSLRLFSL